jgi:hypothetical protein
MSEAKSVQFYLGEPDSKGRYLNDILKWSDEELEKTHDYIQWMFPLPEPSQFNHDAPVLNEFEIELFKSSAFLRKKLSESVVKFTSFLESTSKTWLVEYNHNHLRITRMLRCLCVLGMRTTAETLLNKMVFKASGIVSDTSIKFWQHAVENTIG